MYVLLSSSMESEFEIPGHGSDYCIILVSKLKLLALLFSSVICIFKKHRCLTCHHYCGFSVLHFQYWLAKKISAAWTTVQTTDSSVLFTIPSPEVTKGPKQPYTCSEFLKCITMQQMNTYSSKIQNTSKILLKPERHCKIYEHVMKGDEYKTN